MQIQQIQNNIKKNNNILKISNSLKIMSMIRLKNFQKQKKNLEISLKFLEKNFLEKKKEVLEKKNKILYIFLFTDMSFCGNYNKIITEKFLKNQNELSFIIGYKGKKLKGNFLGKLYDKFILNKLYESILNLKENLSIYIEEYTLNSFSFFFSNDYDKFYLKYFLSFILNKFKVEECKNRLKKVTTAINNSEYLKQNLQILYNKTRQSIITSSLLEVISGINKENF